MNFRSGLVAAMAALCVVACGGGGGGDAAGSGLGGTAPPPPTAAPITSAVKVVGDSLSDSGTFGIKFTVQGRPAHPIWTDHVAAAFGLPFLCPRYLGQLNATPALNPAAAACTSYGVAGAHINPMSTMFDTQPQSIVQQFTDMSAAGPFDPNEVLLVNGGGNDILGMVEAFIPSIFDGGQRFLDLTGELLSPAEVAGSTLPQVGVAYAAKLANLLADAVEAQALGRGARRVVVLTVPDVSVTPRFMAWRRWMAGFHAAGAAQLAGQADEWSAAFNAQIKARFAGHGRVLVVDFQAELNAWLRNPALYGFTHTTTPACPVLGDPGHFPAYDISICTDADLDAAPRMGESGPGWWTSYLFADDFHGTPHAHERMGELVVKALEAKGWK